METHTNETDKAYHVVLRLLNEEKYAETIDVIRKLGAPSRRLQDIHAICLMRMGKASMATEIYRRLLVHAGTTTLKENAPLRQKTNYATALLVARNFLGCQTVLSEINRKDDPVVMRLYAAMKGYIRSLTWKQRFVYRLTGTLPDVDVQLDFAPGDIEDAAPAQASAA